MKTNNSIFIIIIALLLGTTTTVAQGTKAYFKKDGVTVFQSAISDIDSIIFVQELEIPDIIKVSFPSEAISTNTPTLEQTFDDSLLGLADELKKFIYVSDITSYQIKINIGNQLPSDEKIKVSCKVPQQLLPKISDDNLPVVMVLVYQDGGEEILDNFEAINSEYDPLTNEIVAFLPYYAFTNKRNGSYEAIVTIGLYELFIDDSLKSSNSSDVSTTCVLADAICPLPFCPTPSGFFGESRTEGVHRGVDYSTPDGTPILAVMDGRIYGVGEQTGYGKYVWLDHGKYGQTLYAHLSKNDVKTSGTVKKGDIIGYTGHTGTANTSHLHFEHSTNRDPASNPITKQSGVKVNPIPCIDDIVPLNLMPSIVSANQKCSDIVLKGTITGNNQLLPFINSVGFCWGTGQAPEINTALNNYVTLGRENRNEIMTNIPVDRFETSGTYYVRFFISYFDQTGIFMNNSINRRIIYSASSELKVDNEEAQICAILEKLYHDTNGDNWYRKDNWLSEESINDWYGITYSRGNLKINLTDNNLNGSINVNGCTILTTLWCNQNHLSTLNVSGCFNLGAMDCSSNPLNNLNVSGCTRLTTLYSYSNQFTSLNVSGCSNLSDLYCYSGKLSTLNVSGCSNLEYLDCSFNSLTSLNVSNCSKLKQMYCNSNSLISLNVSGCINFTYLHCGNNRLTSLDVGSCSNLKTLDCSFNSLTSLNVSGCTNLASLNCYSNQIQSSIPSWFSQLYEFLHDVRYSYYYDYESGETKYIDNGVGWWYQGEPDKGYHGW